MRKMFSAERKMQHKMDMLNFASKVGKIMTDLNVPDNTWAIGGSVATMLYGCELNRIPHDIDVIVTDSIFNFILEAVKSDFRYQIYPMGSSTDSEFNTKHFAFKSIGSPMIDIIATRDEKGVEGFGFCNGKLVSFEHLLKAKKNYHRPKDAEDLKIMEAYYDSVVGKTERKEDTTHHANMTRLGDIDALAALKKKIEEN